MKRMIVLFVIMSCVFMVNVASYAGPILRIQFEFGRKSCDCCGFGICIAEIILTIDNDNLLTKGDRKASAEVSIDGKSLIINFLKESMTESTINKYFGSGYFIMEENYVLPKEICEKLKIKSFIIK